MIAGGVQTLSHLWICACTYFLEFKVILAPFNYVETHCTREPLLKSG